MTSVAAFLPALLMDELGRERGPVVLPSARPVRGAFLYADIAGFTRMTEALQRAGRRGAEEIAGIVGATFRPALAAIHAQGGIVLGFGGDAVHAAFLGAGAVHRADTAARRIQDALAGRRELSTSAGVVSLGITQAIHFGSALSVHLGAAGRRHHLVTGTAIRELALLEARAPRGRIHLSPAARRARLSPPVPAPPPARPRGGRAALQAYLDEKLRSQLGCFEESYRRVAILFLETRGLPLARLQRFFLDLAATLERYDGTLFKSDLSTAGTRWLCVFGFPRAHEDDAERGALAALDVLRGPGRARAVRGGLHAGVVASIQVGSGGRRGFDVMGDVVNTAARVCSAAAWGEVLAPRQLSAQLPGVAVRARGARDLKGKRRPLAVVSLAGTAPGTRRIVVTVPMVGRERELAAIQGLLHGTASGSGAALAIRGEAGMGKSRLRLEASAQAAAMGIEVHVGRCVAFGGRPFGAVAELLGRAIGWSPRRDARAACRRLGIGPAACDRIAGLLAPPPDAVPSTDREGEAARVGTLLAIREALHALARRRPRLVVLEDMHWADEMTREAARWIVRGVSGVPMVVLLVHRPGYEPPEAVGVAVLEELAGDAAARLVAAHLGDAPDSVAEMVIARAGGNPFYVEEVVRHLLQSGALRQDPRGVRLVRPPRPDDLPASLEGLIAARLDGLSAAARRVAQLGAVIGRSFPRAAMEALVPERRVLRAGIDELLRMELLFPEGEAGSPSGARPRAFVFKHALTRDVAYESILMARRRRHHRAVARFLARGAGRTSGSHAATLGFHWERGGDPRRARRCYLEAARSALAVHANLEAERLYRAHLSLAGPGRPSTIAVRNELAGKVLHLLGRTREALATYRVSVRESITAGDHRGRSDALCGIARLQMAIGRMEAARASFAESLRLDRRRGDPAAAARHGASLAIMHAREGRHSEAEALHRAALRHATRRRDTLLAATCFNSLGALAARRGAYADARKLLEQARAEARRGGHPAAQAMSLSNLAILDMDEGRLDDAASAYAAALRIARKIGDVSGEAKLLGQIAHLHRARGELSQAVEHYTRAVAIATAVDDLHMRGLWLGGLGVAYLDGGRLPEARRHFEEARSLAASLGDRRTAGTWTCGLAFLARLMEGNGAEVRKLLAAAREAIEESRDPLQMLNVVVQEGHASLAEGASATRQLETARSIAAALRLGPGSEGDHNVENLAAAVRRQAEGLPLVRGESPDRMSPPLLRWLCEHRPDAVPPGITTSEAAPP